MLLVIVTKITNRSYEIESDSFDINILREVGIAVSGHPVFRLFDCKGKADVDLGQAAFAVVRGNPGCNVIRVLAEWSGIVVLLHPKGNDYPRAMDVLCGRCGLAEVPDWWKELEANGRVCRFTSGGDETGPAFTMKKAVWHLARSCCGRDADAIESVLNGLRQAVGCYTTTIPKQTGAPAVEAATKHVVDSFRKDEMLCTLLDRAIVTNEVADALHFVMNLLVPIVTDLETWEDGRVGNDYIEEFYKARIVAIWTEVISFLENRYPNDANNVGTFLNEETPTAFSELARHVNSGDLTSAQKLMKTWTSQKIRNGLLRRLHEFIPEMEALRSPGSPRSTKQ